MDMGTAIWRGIADFSSVLRGQKQVGQGFDDMDAKSKKAGQAGESFGSKVGSSLQRLGPKLKSTGQGMTVGLTAPALLLGTKAVQSFANFEQSITAAGAKTEATGEQMQQMRDIALQMGADTKFSAGEAATAMDNMAAAGFDAQGVMDAIPGVMLAAQAAGEDLGLTADVTAKAINAFNLEAKDATHVADVFANASNTSAINMQGLGEALAHAGQLGASANQDLEDVVAVLGRLVDMGVPAASAGVGVRQAIQSLQAPTAKSIGFMTDLGLSFRDAEGKMKPLPQILKELEVGLSNANPKFREQVEATGATGEEYKDMAMKAMFGVEGMKAMNLAISDGKPVMLDAQKDADKLTRLQQGLAKVMGEDAAKAWIAARTEAGKFTASGADAVQATAALGRASDGVSKKIGDIMSDTTAARLDQLGGAFETLAIKVLTVLAPAMTSIIKNVTDAVNWFGRFAEAHPTLTKVLVVFGLILAIIGPLLIALGLMATAITAIAAVGAPVILTVLAVVAVIAGLIAVGILLYKNWDKIKGFLVGIWEAIKSAAETVWNGIAGFFTDVWTAISDTAKTVWGGIAGFFGGLWNGVKSVFTTVWGAISGFLSTVWGGIKTGAAAVWGALVGIVMGPVNLIKSWLMATFNTLLGWWRGFWGMFGGLITAVWDLIVAIVRLGATLVVEIIKTIWMGIVAVAKSIWGAVSKQVQAIWKGMTNAAKSIWGTLSGAAKTAWTAVLNVVKPILAAIKNAVVTAANGIKSGVQTVWNAIKSAASASWNAISGAVVGAARAIWGKISGPLASLRDGIGRVWGQVKSAAGTAWSGLVNTISSWVGKIGGVVSGVKDRITRALSNAGNWLKSSGRQIIQGLIDGITEKIKGLTDVINGISDKVARFFPGSPVKEGPLRVLNRGYVGRKIMEMVAAGIGQGVPKVTRAVGGAVKSIGPIISSSFGLPPGVAPPGASPASGGVVVRPVVRDDGDGGGSGNTYNITAINPVGETTAETTSKAVTRLAVLGVAG